MNGVAEFENPAVEYIAGESLVNMVREDLLLKRLSIESCREIIQYLCDQDVHTCHGLKDILAVKGQRASDSPKRIPEI